MIVVRKDENPSNTIRRIKKILKENKINVKEYKIKTINKKFYSIRIEIKGFYNTGTNGKGESKKYAKASAYAELLERLASKNLINDYFLNKETFKENKLYKYMEFEEYEGNILKSFFNNENYDKEKISNEYKLHSLFNNPIKQKEIFLPIKLIYCTSLSNGLCSGNTYYEAICQGICEIFERYCYRSILEKRIKLNNFKISDDLPIYEKIKYLESLNYCIEIKDCTLGKYPVVGVLILDSTKKNYIFTMGSDPNINIAIQRCLTEAFQGLKSEKELYNKMKSINNNYDNLSNKEKITNWFKNYTSNNGIHPKEMLISNKEYSYKNINIFIDKNKNIDNYNYLLKIIKENHHDIYIKDYSYLSFPVYKVFIPDLSNIYTLDIDEQYVIFNYNIIKNIFYNIEKEYTKEKLIIAINVLKKILKIDRYTLMNVGNYFHSEKYIKTNYNKISFELFYALVCYKNENNSKPSKDIKNNNIKKYLENIEDKNIDSKYLYIIHELKLINPSCPNCNECKCKKTCKYKNWLKIYNIMKKENI